MAERYYLDAYGIWLERGNVGTKDDFIASLKGEKGTEILSITRTTGTGAEYMIDTYTITFTDDTTMTFEANNGTDKANIVQEEWIAPTLINNWVHHDAIDYSIAGYYKDEWGVVHLRGALEGGEGGQNMFVLAPGYRPAKNILFLVSGAWSLGEIKIYPNGGVEKRLGNIIMLDGVSFNAEG